MPSDTSASRSTPPANGYKPPKGAEKVLTCRVGAQRLRVNASADWLVIRENGIPAAEVFYVSYALAGATRRRPVTFLFNGGPGAASAFLHMGTAGPLRVPFGRTGQTLPPPVQLTDNAESWLRFTDLVFVDPVGTGFSRTVHESGLEQHGVDFEDERREKRTKELPEAKKRFFKIKRDIDVLCEFASSFLSRAKRWDSPVFIAGESYGGFRVGKLLKALPERGVGVSGAVMVSPAIDFLHLIGSDYDTRPWTSTIPSMALAARLHGRSSGTYKAMTPAKLRQFAEDFAIEDLSVSLMRPEAAGREKAREKTLATLAALTGLPRERIDRAGGRIKIDMFARELLRDQNKVCGLYDASATGPNVFPDREGEANPDPTLSGIMSAYTAGANIMLRSILGLSTDREYLLLCEDAWKNWSDDRSEGYWQRQLECADDMRYGMAVNPGVRLLVSHGWYDLVTPYFSSARSVEALRLPEGVRERVRLTNYDGGHMFYSWDASRKAFQRDVEHLVRAQAD